MYEDSLFDVCFRLNLQIVGSLYAKAGKKWTPQIAHYKGKHSIPYACVAMMCKTNFK
jgi:hypothetical protein